MKIIDHPRKGYPAFGQPPLAQTLSGTVWLVVTNKRSRASSINTLHMQGKKASNKNPQAHTHTKCKNKARFKRVSSTQSFPFPPDNRCTTCACALCNTIIGSYKSINNMHPKTRRVRLSVNGYDFYQ